ncbi:MAG: hypothetical protein ACJAYW_000779, partial [Candidatus Azotimanducaceae bacterium]
PTQSEALDESIFDLLETSLSGVFKPSDDTTPPGALVH